MSGLFCLTLYLMRHLEYDLQVAVCRYLNYQYAHVLFMSDTIASVKLTAPQAIRNKQIQKDSFKCPDIIIFEPRGQYHGLFIELKKESPYKKNGELFANDHLQGQAKTMQDLIARGYLCHFAWSFEQAKSMIDSYLSI